MIDLVYIYMHNILANPVDIGSGLHLLFFLHSFLLYLHLIALLSPPTCTVLFFLSFLDLVCFSYDE